MKPDSLIKSLTKITPDQAKALERIGLKTLTDVLYYFPVRYSNVGTITVLDNAQADTEITVYGVLSKISLTKGWKSKIPMAKASLRDMSDTNISIIWMHQPYMAKMFAEGDQVKLTGKISEGKNGRIFMNPHIEKTGYLPVDVSDSLFENTDDAKDVGFPIYRETRGITSKWIYHTVKRIFAESIHGMISDPLPDSVLKKFHLPDLKTALVWMHMPEKKEHADAAQKRFAFQEIFLIHVQKAFERKQYQQLFSFKLNVPKKDVQDFIDTFPFEPTTGQMDALGHIFRDIQSDEPMSRLIEGDVGSGKTFLAAVASYATIMNRPAGQEFGNLQVAYMAPTEVLAVQLFENFIEYFKNTGISIGLVTGSGCRKFPTKVASSQKPWTEISKTQLVKWIKSGEIAITVGTHALIAKSIDFHDLGLVIIDEQHRFGTNQRMKLAKKEGHAPHYLSMTATPIPRTLALTIYGDLDISVLDTMPSGRKPVKTELVQPDKRDSAYETMRKELEIGRQGYVICPRISDPDPDEEQKLQLRSVTAEAKRLQEKVFPEYTIGIMHSKMTKQKKEEVMKEFANHEIDILVSTSVIEVGVNVPNASVMIIEGAERFGLSQLHQLRGRVMRASHQPYCFLFSESMGDITEKRLKSFLEAKNGFELAEMDL
ncbi:MAG TPA: ATP-dependent DNA helicase RecG, partial [Candidatus Paceibacterota bacterium]|nr:ATP-dependent DNA helicase RecG [Candidatus Paceibacterota bacterium]